MNCGQKLNENAKFCINCGQQIDIDNSNNNINYQNTQSKQDTVTTNNINNVENTNECNLLCVLSLVLGYGSNVIMTLLYLLLPNESKYIQSIFSLCPIAGLTLMIIARVKYPQSKFAKVVMWIYIVSIGLVVIGFIVLVAACFITCSTMDTSGCN